MAKLNKVLITEMDSGLGPMARARLRLLGLSQKDIILASTHQEATNQVESAREKGVSVAIIGHISRYSGLLDEQELIDTLRIKVPGIAVISCTGRAMMGADVDIPRPVGYLKIEEVVSSLFKKRKNICRSH